ncbi:pentatricopeptide repeat-containing protein, partial [Trifolium medium]|nr:pentatricopeptide repeat-containing protein [Trifolium medium]
MKEAKSMLAVMRDRGQPPDVISYNSFLHTLCKNRLLDEAIALVKKIKDQ